MVGVWAPEQPPIPGYEAIRPLGVNLGVVYLARHSSSGVLVALKVWHLKFAEHARDLLAPLARLHHPNIIRVVEMGEFEEHFFCALEYVEQSLADRLAEGPLADLEVARIARAVGSALQYAHDHEMVPQSLSRKSIFMTDENVPKLTGFCARETFGKPPVLPPFAEIAPECVLGDDHVSETGQVYRMGALMYDLLTARPPFPFTAENAFATLRRVVDEMPVPPRKVNPKVGRDLDAVCMKCLAKQPKMRYRSLQDLLDHLEAFERAAGR